jgi:IS5 family transposase
MTRWWLKGDDGDALRAVPWAAGFNIRWLLRAIARLRLQGLLLALHVMALFGKA